MSLPTASCEIIDMPPNPSPPEITKLCLFKPPLTATDTLHRTLLYAMDPLIYLQTTLPDFASRKHLFCLPEEFTLDAYGTGTTKQAFETHIAKFLGKNHGLFFLTGVQAQLAALKTYAENSGRGKVAWHVSSHLETAECEAFSKLYGLERVLLGSGVDVLPTVDEIRDVLIEHGESLAAIVLEIPNRTLGCQTYSIGELREIAGMCREKDVAMHCDGARLWEAEAWYSAVEGVSFEEICECFDSVYVSFYKGLGGLAGAMLLHNNPVFIEDAKLWQRRAGGNAFTLGVEVLDCQRGFNESIGTFERKRQKMSRLVESIKDATEEFRTEDGEAVVGFIPERAVCSQILTVLKGFSEGELLRARDRVQERTGVRVFERLRPKVSLDEKMAGERMKVVNSVSGNTMMEEEVRDEKVHFMEWMIMSVTEKIRDEVFVGGYVALCEELARSKKEA